MSFLSNHFRARHASGQAPENSQSEIIPTESSLAPVGPDELAKIDQSATRSISLPAGDRVIAIADSLIPLTASAGQAATEYGMAIIRFPEGVGWADLCIRKSDGWNLLSNFKNGKFNDMAAIKQAALQPAAVANLALQGAAVIVGQAYMTQINNTLHKLESGVSEVQRIMERDRDARLKAAYDSLVRLTLKYAEYGASPEKRQIALQIIEDSTRTAMEAWHYQGDAICDLSREIAAQGQLKPGQIEDESARLSEMESHAATAFQLVIITQQVGMRFENDYTSKRIETDQQIIEKMEEDYKLVRGDAHRRLSEKISRVKGIPLVIAEARADGYEPRDPVADTLHLAAVRMDRVNPLRMHEAAKRKLSEQKASLQDEITTENTVRTIADQYEAELDKIDFAFNKADTMLIKGDTVQLLSTAPEGKNRK